MINRIVPIATTLLGFVWAYKGWFEYGFWVDRGPGGGFLPVIVGLLCTLFSIAELVKGAKQMEFSIKWRHFLPVVGCIILFGAVYIFGMVLCLGLFMIAWLVFLEKYPILRATLIGIGTTTLIFFVFQYLFSIPFPTGYLGI